MSSNCWDRLRYRGTPGGTSLPRSPRPWRSRRRGLDPPEADSGLGPPSPVCTATERIAARPRSARAQPVPGLATARPAASCYGYLASIAVVTRPGRRRDGIEYPVWSAVHGLAVLAGPGPLRTVPEATRRRREELTRTFIGDGLTGASPQVPSMVPD
jgi:hypothetical protein